MSATGNVIIYVLTFIAAVAVVQGISDIFFASRDRTERTNRRLTMLASGMAHADVYAALVRRPVTSQGKNVFLLRFYDRFGLFLRQAGLRNSPWEVLLFVAIASATLWMISFFLLRGGTFASFLLNAVIALPASVAICSLLCWMWLSRRRAKRLKQFEEQMPLALDVINRAIRAGHPVVSAVRLAADEMNDPLGSEFGLIVDETTYGYEFRDALINFAHRTGSEDAHFFAVSISVQSETGGNLVDILEGLAAVIRSRSMLAKRVRALSSEGRSSAILLSVLPALLVSFLLLTRPEYYTSKFSDPAFWPVSQGVFVLYLIGLLVIRKIINIKY
jgi:tight adherence protein B